MVNHDCSPNVAIHKHMGEKAIQFFSVKQIMKGEEIVMNYMPSLPFLAAKERLDSLANIHIFECFCIRCKEPDLASNMRRRLLSALLWLITPDLAAQFCGYMTAGSRKSYGAALIVNANLIRRRLSDKRTSLELRRFIRLAIMLFQGEGINDSITVQIINNGNRKYLEMTERDEPGTSLEFTAEAIEDQRIAIELKITCSGFAGTLLFDALKLLRSLRILRQTQLDKIPNERQDFNRNAELESEEVQRNIRVANKVSNMDNVAQWAEDGIGASLTAVHSNIQGN